MATTSPPKPWERGGRATTVPSAAPLPSSAPAPAPAGPAPAAAAAASSSAPQSSSSTMSSATAVAAPTSSSSSAPPAVPSRPSTLASGSASNALTTTGAYNSGVGAYGSGYGSPYGGYNSYSSPYSRMGGYGTGMYGGAGMYGSGMYGSSMYGGGYGMGGYGMGMNPNDPNSFGRSMEASTAATFQMIESIVGAVGGFAQMLESTFMATHSSFFAMVSVAEQFGNLKNTLGSILGIFTIMKYLRIGLSKITGRPPPANPNALNPQSFAQFNQRTSRPSPSKKPLLFFIAAVFGLPYLMSRLIRALAVANEARARALPPPPDAAIDPSQLEFARLKWDYTPQDPAGAGIDLEVKKGDLVAVLEKRDGWWRCRARDGRVGYLPGEWCEVIVRKGGQAGQVAAAPSGQAAEQGKSLVKEFVAGQGQGPVVGTKTM